MALRCVYTDLDGTLLGRYGSLFRDSEGEFSMLQARMLEACHRAGVEVVIKSGRREGSVMEDAKLIGSRSYIYEVGCAVVIDGEKTVLVGDAESDPGRTLAETMVDRGIPDELFEHFSGRLDWHSPWHRQRELSLLFKGKVDVDEANRLLAERGHTGLRLIDNGAIFAPMDGIEGPAHAYHLLPEAASKANAVVFHMRARGYTADQCIAIGDSVEDLAVAEVVGRFFVPANGPERDPALREAIGGTTQRDGHRGPDGRWRLRGGRLDPGGRLMRSIHVTRIIPAPAEEVFDLLADHAHYARFRGITEAELLNEGEPPPNGVGAIRLVVSGPIRFEEEITGYDRPTKLDYLIVRINSPLEHEGGHISLAPDGSATRVDWRSEFRVPVRVIGPAMELAWSIILSRGFRHVLEDVERTLRT